MLPLILFSVFCQVVGFRSPTSSAQLLKELNELNCPAIGMLSSQYCPDTSYSFPLSSNNLTIRMWNFDITKYCPTNCIKHAIIDPVGSNLQVHQYDPSHLVTGEIVQGNFSSVHSYFEQYYSMNLSSHSFWNGLADYVDPYNFYESEIRPFPRDVTIRTAFAQYFLQQWYIPDQTKIRLLPDVVKYLESLGGNYDPQTLSSAVDILGTHVPTKCYFGAIAYTRTMESGCIHMNFDQQTWLQIGQNWTNNWMQWFVNNSGQGQPPNSESYFDLAVSSVLDLRGGDVNIADWPDRLVKSVPTLPVLTKCTDAIPLYEVIDNPIIAANFKRFFNEEYISSAIRSRDRSFRKIEVDLAEQSLGRGIGAGIFQSGHSVEGPKGSIVYLLPGQSMVYKYKASDSGGSESNSDKFSLGISRDTGNGIKSTRDDLWKLDTGQKEILKISHDHHTTIFTAVYHCPAFDWKGGKNGKCYCPRDL